MLAPAAQAATTGHQHAAVHQAAQRKDGTGHYCTTGSGALCLSTDGTSGNPVYTRTQANSSQSTTVGHNVCVNGSGNPTDTVQTGQGTDGPSCPFNNGSGFNLTYDGREIVHFENSAGLCFQANAFSDELAQKACSATGTDYVRAGTDPYPYVNVHATNGASIANYIATTGTAGDQAFLTEGAPGSREMWTKN